MASISRNTSNTLMGFSVHQPAIGASLQFFPAMGSQLLDEMINAYVPGSASILDKRAAVSMEFFEHALATGELFKFFMVYPYLGTAVESPASSSAMQDSGYGSSFNTSPVISESQWTQTSEASSHKAQTSSAKNAATTTADFSHIPGMKIMTKDGRDVTNSASRGCKTKEQRDHAHLMRIIKACEACRKKKIRCDPSHKRRTAGPSEAKVTKKAKVARPAAAPPQKAREETSPASSFDSVIPESISDFDSFFPELNATDSVPMEWDQFIQYDEELVEPVVPYDYDFFSDPAGYFSPANSATNTSSTSPHQPITPALPTTSDTGVAPAIVDMAEEAQAQAPTLPYLNPGGLDAGNNYVDFNLYSPGSSWSLDDDPSLAKEVAASPGLNQSTYFSSRQPQSDRHRHKQSCPYQDASSYEPALQAVDHVADRTSSPQDEIISSMLDHHSYYDRSDHIPSSSPYDSGDTSPESFSSPGLQNLGHCSGERSVPQSALSNYRSGISSGSTRYRLSTSQIELSDPVSGIRHEGDLGSGQSTASAMPSVSSSRLSIDHQDRDKVQSRYESQNSVHAIGGDESSTGHMNSISDRATNRRHSPNLRIPHNVSSSNEARDAQGGFVANGSNSNTTGGFLSRPPLPSPDRPPVMSCVFSSRPECKESFVSENKSALTQAYAELDTRRSTGSSLSATPEHAVATTVVSRTDPERSRQKLRQAFVLQSIKSVSSSKSAISGVAMIAVKSVFGPGATVKDSQASSDYNKSLVQRHPSLTQQQPGSSLSRIISAVGLCGFLCLVSSALGLARIVQIDGGSHETLSVFVVVACIKLLQHSARAWTS